MSWLSKDVQIGMLTMLDMQTQAYDKLLEQYGTHKIAIEHTKIFMSAVTALGNPQSNGGSK